MTAQHFRGLPPGMRGPRRLRELATESGHSDVSWPARRPPVDPTHEGRRQGEDDGPTAVDEKRLQFFEKAGHSDLEGREGVETLDAHTRRAPITSSCPRRATVPQTVARPLFSRAKCLAGRFRIVLAPSDASSFRPLSGLRRARNYAQRLKNSADHGAAFANAASIVLARGSPPRPFPPPARASRPVRKARR